MLKELTNQYNQDVQELMSNKENKREALINVIASEIQLIQELSKLLENNEKPLGKG